MHRAGTGKLLAVAAAFALLPAAAFAAPEGNYKGSVTGDSGKVKFKVDGSKVKKFEIDGVYADCFGGQMLMSVYVPSAKIKGNSFKTTYIPDPESEFQVTLEGRFSGSKASGSVFGEGVCGYEENWTAKKG